jgi:nitric-oxide synthase
MACPWKFLFKARSHQYNLTEEKDINNNVGKAMGAISR